MRGPFASPVEAAEANGAAVRRQMQELDVKDPCKLPQCIAHKPKPVHERPCLEPRCGDPAMEYEWCQRHYGELAFEERRLMARHSLKAGAG